MKIGSSSLQSLLRFIFKQNTPGEIIIDLLALSFEKYPVWEPLNYINPLYPTCPLLRTVVAGPIIFNMK